MKWRWNLFYSKVIAKSVNTFIPLGDKMINSSPVHNLTHSWHFLVLMKPTRRPRMSFFRSRKMWSHKGRVLGVRRMLKCFPVKSLIGSVRTGVIMQNDDSVRQYSRAFWLYVASQHPQPPRKEPHLSALLFLPPFPMLDEHTLHYSHLQSN